MYRVHNVDMVKSFHENIKIRGFGAVTLQEECTHLKVVSVGNNFLVNASFVHALLLVQEVYIWMGKWNFEVNIHPDYFEHSLVFSSFF